MESCPCKSGRSYAECCEPLISGQRIADTAEELMRSRYSAYTTAAVDYLYETTHPNHRQGYDHKGTKIWAENSEWENLEIVNTKAGKSGDNTGEVEFIATYKEKGVRRVHHEAAAFSKEEGHWLFTEGKMVAEKPATSNKVGRNEPCPCGSGAKYKKCCGA
ncbi:YchJ family protein [Geobacter sp. DSM 9736]|uniref:YchJ family protein n=1 Tax=Geobacter sp. DSM 9736 TaxID=1277350 RepID=UPI000B5062EA|nr:YchJ family protein [Geobacter sp. DSM 9736]SNB47874.1 SEC-C motif-containing protein [Geobacter sp. DSM 9736]